MAGMQVASTVAGIAGRNSAANAQLEGLADQRRTQAQEIQDQAEVRMGDRVRQYRRERARMRVAAGEAGVAGASFEASLAASLGNQNQDLAILNKEAQQKDRASQTQYSSAVARVQKPNLIQSALQIAGAGAGGYQQGLQVGNLQRLQIPGG
tara:strand:- start:1383 stop:1838 length:456 start_codon:yes stop_codon:yes gene_type:complete